MQEVKHLLRAQRALEALAITASTKCLYSVYGYELKKDIAEDPWGGIAATSAPRSNMSPDTALDIFWHVKDEVMDLLEAGSAGRSKLARHRPLLEQLHKAFPQPQPQVCKLTLNRCSSLLAHAEMICRVNVFNCVEPAKLLKDPLAS
jgi:hypothetical protein